MYFLLNGEAKHTQGVRWMVTLTKNSGAQLVLIERNIIKKEIGVIVIKNVKVKNAGCDSETCLPSSTI